MLFILFLYTSIRIDAITSIYLFYILHLHSYQWQPANPDTTDIDIAEILQLLI